MAKSFPSEPYFLLRPVQANAPSNEYAPAPVIEIFPLAGDATEEGASVHNVNVRGVAWFKKLSLLANATEEVTHEPIHKVYQSIGISHQLPQDAHAADVCCIEWFKNADRLQHEYLILTVQRDSDMEYLRLERRPSQNCKLTKMLALGSRHQRHRVRYIKKEQGAIRPTSSDPCLANDTVGHGTTDHRDNTASLVASYSSFRNTLSLHDFIVAADLVSTYSIEYSLFLRQCYWFCRTVVGVVNQTYSPQVISQGCAFKYRGSYSPAYFFRLPINKDCPMEVNDIYTKLLEKRDQTEDNEGPDHTAAPGGKVGKGNAQKISATA